jgi:HTH-type transcriptional regulator / antitoxin HigA
LTIFKIQQKSVKIITKKHSKEIMETLEIKTLKTEIEYKDALKKLELVWNALPNTPDGEKLELLLLVIEDYESKNYPIPKLDPIEAIKYKMEEQSLNQADLIKYFGTKSRVSEVLNRKKPLTLRMIKSLYQNFGISADSLLAI